MEIFGDEILHFFAHRKKVFRFESCFPEQYAIRWGTIIPIVQKIESLRFLAMISSTLEKDFYIGAAKWNLGGTLWTQTDG